MRVGFIGAGRMGAPMVSRLVAAGHQVQALGRDDDKRAALTELGARAVDSAGAAVGDAEVVVLCVFTDDQVRELCLPDGPGLIEAMQAGCTLILHTTGSPRTAETLAHRGAARDIAVIDAPVSGGPHDIAAGRVTVFAGGEADAVERARPVLSCYAEPVLHVGPVGSGQRVKLVNNTLFAAQIGLVAEVVRLGGRLGIDEATLLSALTHGSAASRALAGVAATGSADRFIARVGEFIGKDVAVVRRTVTDLGGDLTAFDALLETSTGAAAADLPH